jgi:elongation factor P
MDGGVGMGTAFELEIPIRGTMPRYNISPSGCLPANSPPLSAEGGCGGGQILSPSGKRRDMSTYNTSEFRKGLKVLVDNEPYLIVDTEFMKPGKGQAVYRVKLKNLVRGNVIDRTYRSGDKIDGADVAEETLQYLYNDTKNWIFMNSESFEQHSIPKELLDDAHLWLKENMEVEISFFGEKPISVAVPKHAELIVKYCEPGAKGNTATNVLKAATLETGVEVQVPMFINMGDVVKVDTRTHEYIERVSKS